MTPSATPQSHDEAQARRNELIARNAEVQRLLRETRTGTRASAMEREAARRKLVQESRAIEDELGFLRAWLEGHRGSSLDLLRRCQEAFSDLSRAGTLWPAHAALLLELDVHLGTPRPSTTNSGRTRGTRA